MVGEVESIIGDLNCCGGTKKRRLEEFINKQTLEQLNTPTSTGTIPAG